MAYISKIKLANGSSVDIKDAEGRANVTTLLGGHALEALGAAAWKAVAANISGEGLIDAAVVKSYVDSQVGQIHNFDVVVDAAGTVAAGPSVTASADTMYKIYLVPSDDAAAGGYIEYITIRSGAEGAYTYAWEAIGNTKVSLSGYVPTTTTIATIALDHNITVAELQGALKLGAMAYADKANGSTTLETVDSITMKPVTVAGNATVTTKAADATLTKGDFTPAGTVSAPAIDLTSTEKTFVTGLTGGKAASFTEGAFTPAAFQEGFYTAGAIATWTGKEYVAPTMGNATTGQFASEGIVATVGTGEDSETLIFSAASKADAVTAQGEFNAGNVNFGTFDGGRATVIDISKFSGGSKAKDTFSANILQTVETGTVNDVTAATATAPTFTGTKSEGILVTGVSYDKADAAAAFSVNVTPETQAITKTAKTIEIEVSPVAKA